MSQNKSEAKPEASSGVFALWHRSPLYLRIVGGMVLGVVVGLSSAKRQRAWRSRASLVLALARRACAAR